MIRIIIMNDDNKTTFCYASCCFFAATGDVCKKTFGFASDATLVALSVSEPSELVSDAAT